MKNILFESLSTRKKGGRKSSKAKLLPMFGDETVLNAKDTEVLLSSSKRLSRLMLAALLLLLVFLTFISRAFIFQILKGNEYFALSEKNSIRNFTIQAERGVIYDRNDKVIVRNKPSFSLELSVDLCKSKEVQDKCVEEHTFR